MPDIKNSQFPASDLPLAAAAATLGRRLPPGPSRRGPGSLAAVAGLLEATARKPGNVHPGASFSDLAYADLSSAAVAIAEPLTHAGEQPLGETIEAAVTAARAASRSNANLGIVLAIAPLAAADGSGHRPTPEAVRSVLSRCTAADAAAIYRAIRAAGAGGLGRRQRHDINGPPPASILTAMREAAEAEPRDSIAALWADGYEPLWAGPVADLVRLDAAGCGWEETIVRAAVCQLARQPDSLIARRRGSAAAAAVSRQAARLVPLSGPAWADGVAAFDRSLRQPPRRNPGTTADLIAAAIYVLLRNQSGEKRPPN